MIWILITFIVGLLAVLGQLLLSYQKRAHDLRFRMQPLHRRIRSHRKLMQESVEKIQEAASSRVKEINEGTARFKEKLHPLTGILEDLEKEAFSDEEAGQEEDEEVKPPLPPEDSEEVKVAREARNRYEALDSYLTSMVRDVELIQRLLGRLDGKLEARGVKKKESKKARG